MAADVARLRLPAPPAHIERCSGGSWSLKKDHTLLCLRATATADASAARLYHCRSQRTLAFAALRDGGRRAAALPAAALEQMRARLVTTRHATRSVGGDRPRPLDPKTENKRRRCIGGRGFIRASARERDWSAGSWELHRSERERGCSIPWFDIRCAVGAVEGKFGELDSTRKV